jgi:arginase
MYKKVKVVGVQLDLGQTHRGVNMGPSAIRYAGLSDRLRQLGYDVQDMGNIEIPIRETLLEKGFDSILPAIIYANEQIYKVAEKCVKEDSIPIFLGGDHSIAIGTIGGVTAEKESGVIWVDAHGDFNNPQSSKSGNIHGMPLAVLLGDGYEELVNIGRTGAKLKPENVVLVGLRDLDSEEQRIIKNSGVKYFTMRDIDEKGISNVMQESLDHLKTLDRIHVSLDIDSIDPTIAPGVGTPVRGGLSYREAHLAMEIIADSKKLSSLDIVEINPMLDSLNKTAELAVEMAVSLFGKSII